MVYFSKENYDINQTISSSILISLEEKNQFGFLNPNNMNNKIRIYSFKKARSKFNSFHRKSIQIVRVIYEDHMQNRRPYHIAKESFYQDQRDENKKIYY